METTLRKPVVERSRFVTKCDKIQEAYEHMLQEAEKIDWANEVDIAKINLQKGNRFALVFSDKDWVPTLFAKNQSILKSLMKQEFKKRKNMKLMGIQEFIQQYKHYTPKKD